MSNFNSKNIPKIKIRVKEKINENKCKKSQGIPKNAQQCLSVARHNQALRNNICNTNNFKFQK
jgi:hypothetical protein